MSESDHEYFPRRAVEERDAAGRADLPVARQTHLELAARYDEVAAACSSSIIMQLKVASRG